MHPSIVVIPTYNEANNIGPLIHAVRAAMRGLDILVVDDGSPDGTGEIAATHEGVHLIQRGAKLGLGTAYVRGFTWALERGYRSIAGMDADFSHDPALLPTLFGLLGEFDVVVGARYLPGGGVRNWALHRRVLSYGANRFARLMLGLPVHDLTSGYRCYRREVLEAVQLGSLKSEGYAFLVELLFRACRAGFSVGETPIVFVDRQRGASKLDRREIWYGIMNLVRLRFRG